ncbi:MAG: DUF1194 domain-containing protein [Pseudomonadota bacterium]
MRAPSFLKVATHSVMAGVLSLSVLVGSSSQSPLRSQSVRTDVNIVIAIDCSYSVNSAEYRLQTRGIANALLSPEVIEAIKGGPEGRVGLTVIQWSGPDVQEVAIPWTAIGDAEDAYIVADQMITAPRMTAEGVTAIGSAIAFAVELHQAAPFWAERQVIDMQADGTSTWSRGVPIQQARDHAVRQGITVNGLPILNEVPFLHHYFENHVIGGPGSFIEIADDYDAFADAIKRKLIKEIRGLSLS